MTKGNILAILAVLLITIKLSKCHQKVLVCLKIKYRINL